MKAIWKGSISFGLVNIPVKLYSVAEQKQIRFRLLCAKCHTPLKYNRYCRKCKKEVAWVNVVKGVKIGNKYVVLTKEQLKKLKPLKTDIIEVIAFVDANYFSPILFNNNYYIVPAKKKEKAYWLFLEILKASAKAAFCKITIKEKEQLAIIRYYKNVLLLTTLYYPHELRLPEQLEELKSKVVVTRKELQLAKMLLSSMSKEEINFGQYKDEFLEKLKKVIEGKHKQTKKPQPKKLLNALKLSVKATRKS